MAKTLMSRPYIFSSSSKTFSCLFLQPKRPFVSQTTVLLTRSKSRMSSSFKLPIRSDRQLATNSRLGDVVHRRFTTRATHVNDAGSIDSPLMQSMENKVLLFAHFGCIFLFKHNFINCVDQESACFGFGFSIFV